MGAAWEGILPSGKKFGAKILMKYFQGGDLSARKRILKYSNFWLSYNLLKTFHIRS